MKLCPVIVGLLLAVSSVPQIIAQTPAPTFDVASVKPNKSGEGGMRIMFQPGGRFVATNVTLKMLVHMSYGIQDFQITGGPAWIVSDRYDIEARGAGPDMGAMRNMTEEQRKAANDVRKQMIQALLADRFKLILHKESKEAPIYALVVAKSGLKIKELPPEVKPPPGDEPKGPPDKPDPNHPMRGGMRMGRGGLTGQGIKLSFLADALSDQVGRKVFDKTGLTGDYNFELKWTPDDSPEHPGGDASSPDANGPTIFTALQEQLGLKLDPQKGPVDLVVIDHAEKASEN
jgi:uncharacterized protein (TIGR03435 family)